VVVELSDGEELAQSTGDQVWIMTPYSADAC
jgi:hypothetical protein